MGKGLMTVMVSTVNRSIAFAGACKHIMPANHGIHEINKLGTDAEVLNNVDSPEGAPHSTDNKQQGSWSK